MEILTTNEVITPKGLLDVTRRSYPSLFGYNNIRSLQTPSKKLYRIRPDETDSVS